MNRPLRASSLLVVLLVAVTSHTQAAESPASAAISDSKISAARIDEAVHQLGDRDFRVRERATRTLWAAGATAQPALRKALDAGDADPETARRIRSILSNITYGITPDMSADVIALMTQYRTGDGAAKRAAAGALAQRGASGARVLLKLRAEERDAQVRQFIAAVIQRQSRDLAVALIGDGDITTTGRLLALAVEGGGGEAAAMNYAALLLVNGGLDDAIAETRARLDKAGTKAGAAAAANPAVNDAPESSDGLSATDAAMLLAFLHRAKGDLPAARAAAERSGDELLLHNILVELGDWKELARRSDARIEQADVEELSFGAAFHRLAGDEPGVDRYAKLLRSAADRTPDDSWNAAEGLLLNGRVDLGIEVLTHHQHLAAAMDFQSQRLAFDEIPRLIERARASESAELGEVEAKAARAAWFTGDLKAATAALDAAADACFQRQDLPGLIAAVGVANDMGLADRARWHTVRAMQVAQRMPRAENPVDGASQPLTELFERARFREAARAAGWWQILRARFPREPAGNTLDKLRAIDDRKMPGDDLQALCDASASSAKRRQHEFRDAQLELIADTLEAAGRRQSAIARYSELIVLAADTSPERATAAMMKLAKFDEEAGHWRTAADRYWDVWRRDRANPVPLLLSGWATLKAGDKVVGEQRIARAHLIPLADQNRRFDLYEALLERKMTDDARRELTAILRTSEFLSWRRSEALRRAGDEAHAGGDALRAADLWEQAFLDNNSGPTRFVDPWANVSMPALIRRTRAVGLVRTGKVAEGIREAETCLAMSPGDADAVIDAVTALDETKHKPEADALYARVAGRFKKLAEDHPDSGPLNNLYAWTAAKCHRELDAALTHARRAVTLQPSNTASLDTLAETHFQRGEIDQAIAAMERCAEMEPEEPRHKQQLERFRKALGTTTRPAPK